MTSDDGRAPRLDLVDAFLAHLRLSGASGYTIEGWSYILDRAHRQLPHGLDSANADDLRAWLGRPGWSAKTRACYKAALAAFFGWATDPADPWLDHDPTRYLPRIRVERGTPKPCTDAELTHILTTGTDPVRLWALLAAYQGARCIEIARLQREHVTEAGTVLHGKGDKHRTVPTHPDVWAAVHHFPPGPIVRDRAGRPVTGRHVSRNSVRYLHHVLAMPGMHLHRLRHWYLTQVLRSTRDLRLTQDLAGHASPDTTAVYTAVADDLRRAAVMGLPRLAPDAGAAGGASADPPPHR